MASESELLIIIKSTRVLFFCGNGKYAHTLGARIELLKPTYEVIKQK